LGIVVLVATFFYSYRKIIPFKIAIDNLLVTAPIISPVIK
jgi:hypothetical protein